MPYTVEAFKNLPVLIQGYPEPSVLDHHQLGIAFG
jgi:hypothetical protein